MAHHWFSKVTRRGLQLGAWTVVALVVVDGLGAPSPARAATVAAPVVAQPLDRAAVGPGVAPAAAATGRGRTAASA